MPDLTEVERRLQRLFDSFKESVNESERGIPDSKLPELIDQLVVTFAVFYTTYKLDALPEGTKRPRPVHKGGSIFFFHPPSYSDDECSSLAGCRTGLMEWFGEQCEHLAAALATNNPYVSTHLFLLGALFEDQETERIHEVWPTVEAGLRCVQAQQRGKSVDERGKPRLSDRQGYVLDIIREEGPIQEKEIERRLSQKHNLVIGAGTLRKWDIPVLKEHYGVETSGDGYYIPE